MEKIQEEWEVSTKKRKNNTGEEFENAFFRAFPHAIIKQERIFKDESLTENCFWWTGEFWKRFKPLELEGIMNSVLLDDLGIEASCRKNDLKKTFLARRCISEKELNIDGKFFFNTKSGVIDLIKLKELAEELGENFNGETLIRNREKWLFPHEDFKDNHFTCLAPITIPETFDEEKFKKDIAFLRKTFMKSMGDREDSFEWIMNLNSSSVSGEPKGDHFGSLLGATGAGKTTLVKLIGATFGEEYARTVEPEDLASKSEKAIKRFYRARYARIINVSEPSDKRLNTSFIKKLTGKSNILVGYDGESLNLDSFILIDSNHQITPDEADPSALKRRYIIIPFGPKIAEENQDKKLAEKLTKIRESFFLELLLRFPHINVGEISTPPVTQEVLETTERFKNPVKFFLETCTVPALDIHGGCNVAMSELYRIFKQHFHYIYEAKFKDIFYHNDDFHVDLAEISMQRFTVEVEKIYHNITIGHAGARFVNNIIVRNPGNFSSVREMQIENLKNVYCVATDDKSAEEIITETEKPGSLIMPDSPNDAGFSDVLWFNGCPSFKWMCLPPVKVLWENQLLKMCIFGACNPLYTSHLCEFTNWLALAIGFEKAQESLCLLKNLISQCATPQIAENNTEIRKTLNQFFDIYLKFVRGLRPTQIGAKNPRRISLATSQKKELPPMTAE